MSSNWLKNKFPVVLYHTRALTFSVVMNGLVDRGAPLAGVGGGGCVEDRLSAS
jgi:hypothetical protein